MKGVTLSKEEEEPKAPQQIEGMIATTAALPANDPITTVHEPLDTVPVSASVLKLMLEKIDSLTAGLLAVQNQPRQAQTSTNTQTNADVTHDHPMPSTSSMENHAPASYTATHATPEPTLPVMSAPTTTPKFLNRFVPGKISSKFVETSVDQLESWFTINNITDDEEKFAILKLSMEPETYLQVAAIIQNPPPTNKFDALKNHIIKTFTQSEASRIKSLLNTIELGNRRPSQLLAEMSALYKGPKDRIFVELFTSRLPSTVRGILMGMQSPNAGVETPIETLAQWADAITEQLDKGEKISSIQGPTSEPNIGELLLGLTNSINAFNERAHNQPRHPNKPPTPRPNQRKNLTSAQRESRKPNNWNNGPPAKQPERRRDESVERHETCWYHRTFGQDAVSCRTPCAQAIQPKN